MMPDYIPASDDDEWIEPYYNDPGEFGDSQTGDAEDD